MTVKASQKQSSRTSAERPARQRWLAVSQRGKAAPLDVKKGARALKNPSAHKL
jgi:hypothetical protein